MNVEAGIRENGTTFTLVFPHAVIVRGPALEGTTQVLAKILVVNDDAAIRRLLRNTLDRMSYIVAEAEDAESDGPPFS